MNKAPRNWPKDVTYLQAPVYHNSVPSHLIPLLRSGISPSSISSFPSIPIAPSDHSPTYTIIQKIEFPSHPANGQLGLFASKKIPPNTMIVYYFGQVHAEQRPTSDYDLSLLQLPCHSSTSATNPNENNYIHIGIDAQLMGNEARCINDYRGITQKPNALFKEVKHPLTGELRMSVWSGTKPIAKHQEILVSYGKGWWRARTVVDE